MRFWFGAGILLSALGASFSAMAATRTAACTVIAVPELTTSLAHLALQTGLAEQVDAVRVEIAWNLSTDPQARQKFDELKNDQSPMWESVRTNLGIDFGSWMRLFPQLHVELFGEFPSEVQFVAGSATAPMYFKADGDEILVHGRTAGDEVQARTELGEAIRQAGGGFTVKSFRMIERERPSFGPSFQIWEARVVRRP